MNTYTYNYWKEQLRLSRVSGNSTCPFCGGTKTTPFVRQGKSQSCTECNKETKHMNMLHSFRIVLITLMLFVTSILMITYSII